MIPGEVINPENCLKYVQGHFPASCQQVSWKQVLLSEQAGEGIEENDDTQFQVLSHNKGNGVMY